jgi:FkbM family methyltransferase
MHTMSQDQYIHLQTQTRLSVFCRKVRVAITPENMLLTARLKSGLRIRGRNKAGWGGRGVFIFREDIEPELDILPKLLPRGGVFIDVGANIGVYSVVAADIVGENGIVVAIEPFAEIYAQLCDNVARNGFRNVIRTRNMCLNNSTGPTLLWMNTGRPHAFSLQRQDGAAGISVLSLRLDDLVKIEELKRLDYLKIDAEGAERLILEGGQATVALFRPIIQVEDINRSLSRCFDHYSALNVPGTRNVLLIPYERLESARGTLGPQWEITKV